MDGELERLMKLCGRDSMLAQKINAADIPTYIFRKLMPVGGESPILLLDSKTHITSSENDDATFDYVMISRGLIRDLEFYDCITFSIFEENEPTPKIAFHLDTKLCVEKDSLRLSGGREWAKIEYDPEKVLYIPVLSLN